MQINWPLLPYAGVPTNGVNEIQSVAITGTPNGGSFTLTLNGQTTAAIPYNATAAQVEAALLALNNIDPGDVQCAGGPLPGAAVTVTFRKQLGGKNITQMTADGTLLTGGTLPAASVSTSTGGVQGTYRGAQPNALLCDTTNGVLYENTGDQYTPVWSALEP